MRCKQNYFNYACLLCPGPGLIMLCTLLTKFHANCMAITDSPAHPSTFTPARFSPRFLFSIRYRPFSFILFLSSPRRPTSLPPPQSFAHTQHSLCASLSQFGYLLNWRMKTKRKTTRTKRNLSLVKDKPPKEKIGCRWGGWGGR